MNARTLTALAIAAVLAFAVLIQDGPSDTQAAQDVADDLAAVVAQVGK